MNANEEKEKKVCFLLAEDDEDHAELVFYNLEKSDLPLQIQRVKNGEEVLLFLRQEAPYENSLRPDLIILDINMPKLNGLEVLEIIKKDPKFKSIPTVVLTTSDAENDRKRAYEFHANSYLIKPMSFESFSNMIQDLSRYWALWNCSPGEED